MNKDEWDVHWVYDVRYLSYLQDIGHFPGSHRIPGSRDLAVPNTNETIIYSAFRLGHEDSGFGDPY